MLQAGRPHIRFPIVTFFILPNPASSAVALSLTEIVTILITHYATKTYGGSGCIDPSFLDVGTS
jgi:hypothetical protein